MSAIEAQNKLGLDARGASAHTALSRAWFQRAQQVLAGGISSSARAVSTGNLPYPLYMARGDGSRIWDVDGNQYIDYLLSYGSTILGHNNAALTGVITDQLSAGTMFGTCNMPEVELAEQICAMVPCAELVRYANSGSEAICGAVRARGFTGRNKILKFEGHYHGWVDLLAISNRPTLAEAGPLETPVSRPHSRGIPPSTVREVVIAPWNDATILRNILNAHEGQIAAIIAEPVVANNACIMPVPGFLETLREECTQRGIVLIFDEIVTGFRMAPGGAQEFFGVVPDLAVFSKAIGGGLPISAFAGKRKIMELIGKNTVKHGGTYNGNPLCAAAALHTLRHIAQEGVLARMLQHGQTIQAAIQRAARDYRIPCCVQGVGTMFQVVFNAAGTPLRHYRDLLETNPQKYAAFHRSLLEQGVFANSSGAACWFISIAHNASDVQQTCAAIDVAMRSLR